MTKRSIAIVTGTSSGFGFLITLALAKNGYKVIATMRNKAKQAELAEAAHKQNISEQIEYCLLDVTDHQAIRKTIHNVITRYGHIDLLVNNAGISLGGFVEEVPLEDWKQSMETNFFGLVALTKEVLPHMRKVKSGKIINIGSVSGRLGFPGYGPYAASKFALAGFSESLRMEMLPHGVYVSLVEPGAFKTDIWSKGFDHIATREVKESPYQESLATIIAYSQNVAEHASDPHQVANYVVRIAQTRYPKLRYVLGRGAFVVIVGKILLPWKWFEKIVWRMLRK